MNNPTGILWGVLVFSLGQILGWFQLNSQFIWKWWESKPIISALVFGLPTSIVFWYAWRMISISTDSVWSARFIGSGTGFLVFPLLTYFCLGESMFTVKTLSCLTLSIAIILIQIYA